MHKNIIVKRSKIHGKGVFALRDFKKGETVIKWKLKPLKKSEIKTLPIAQKRRIMHIDEKHYLMQSPCRYVNHSCQPNAKNYNMSNITIKDIQKGEEITIKYKKSFTGGINFSCHCQGKKCKETIIYS